MLKEIPVSQSGILLDILHSSFSRILMGMMGLSILFSHVVLSQYLVPCLGCLYLGVVILDAVWGSLVLDKVFQCIRALIFTLHSIDCSPQRSVAHK